MSGMPFPQNYPFPWGLKIIPSHEGSQPLSNMWFLGTTRLSNPNVILIDSAIFEQLTADSSCSLQWATPPPKKLPLPIGDLDPQLIHGSLGPLKSTTQTVSRSFQPFLQGSLLWHATRSLIIGRIYVPVCSTAMWLNKCIDSNNLGAWPADVWNFWLWCILTWTKSLRKYSWVLQDVTFNWGCIILQGVCSSKIRIDSHNQTQNLGSDHTLFFVTEHLLPTLQVSKFSMTPFISLPFTDAPIKHWPNNRLIGRLPINTKSYKNLMFKTRVSLDPPSIPSSKWCGWRY